MPKYPVFTSYAQADLLYDPQRHLEAFVEDFREQLRSQLGLHDAEFLVFFDQHDVSGGDDWMKRILEVVRTADVLVCLMSPTYLGREWCGRELEVFIRRNDLMKEEERTRFVVPIWWQPPTGPRKVPSRVGKFNYRDPQYPPDYEKCGVKGLARQRKVIQLRRMAGRIAELVTETLEWPHRLPPGEVFASSEEIANAFDEQQPYDVRLLALTTGGDAWRPSTMDATVAEAAEQVARRLQVFVRPVKTGVGLAAGLQQAQMDEQVVLVVVDAASAVDMALKTVDALALPNLVVLLVDAGSPAMGADAWFARLPSGAFAAARAAGLLRVATAGSLVADMEQLIDEGRRRLRLLRPAARAEDPRLAAEARARGIEVETQPLLSGPGGNKSGAGSLP
jgi:hypothetical protein